VGKEKKKELQQERERQTPLDGGGLGFRSKKHWGLWKKKSIHGNTGGKIKGSPQKKEKEKVAEREGFSEVSKKRQ